MSHSESFEKHWEAVEGSSNINAVCYDGTRGDLLVRFHNGGTYIYSNVPGSVYRNLMAAESKGRYFHQNIKGQYGCSKVEE